MTMTDAAAPRGLKGVIVADTAARRRARPRGLLPLPPVLGARARRDPHVRGRLVPALRGRAAVRRGARRVRAPRSRRCGTCPPTLLELLPAIAGAATRTRSRALRTALSHLAAVEDMPPTYDADPETHPRQRAAPRARRRRCSSPRCTARRSALAPIAPRADLGHRRELPLHDRRRGPRPGARPRDRAVPHPRHRPRLQRVDVHRARRDVDRCRRRRRGRRRARRALGPVARRRAEPRARHARRHRHARRTPRRGCATRSPAASASWASATRSTAPPIPAR